MKLFMKTISFFSNEQNVLTEDDIIFLQKKK